MRETAIKNVDFRNIEVNLQPQVLLLLILNLYY